MENRKYENVIFRKKNNIFEKKEKILLIGLLCY